MHWRSIALASTAMCALPAPAHANDLYFHRAGAEWSQYETDVNHCLVRTAATQANTQSASAVGGGLAGIIGAAIGNAIVAGIQVHQERRRNISYCMAMRGWTAVDIDNLRGEDNQRIDVDLLLDERIMAWFSRPSPPVGRVFLGPKDVVRIDQELPAPVSLETAIAERDARRRNRK